MMRIIYILLFLLSSVVGAQSSSLSHSVNQAKTQGKVLSAKTKNGEYVVKVLTPDGRIKTIRQPVKSLNSTDIIKNVDKEKSREKFSKKSRNKSNDSKDRNKSYSEKSRKNKFIRPPDGRVNKNVKESKGLRSKGRNKKQ